MRKIWFYSSYLLSGFGGGAQCGRAFLCAFADYFGCIDEVCSPDIEIGSLESCAISNFVSIPGRSIFRKMEGILGLKGFDRTYPFLDRRIRGARQKPDLLILNSANMGRLAGIAQNMGIPVLTLHHNVERDYYAGASKGWGQRLLKTRLAEHCQKRSVRNSRFSIFISQHDMETFSIPLRGSANKIKSCLPFDAPDLTSQSGIRGFELSGGLVTLSIIGSLDNHQSEDGLCHFLKEIWPSLKNDCGMVQLIVAGSSPSIQIKDLCGKESDIHLIGNPRDLIEIYKRTDIFVCPTRLGSGIKIKIFDALRCGKPIIAHASSVRGLGQKIQGLEAYSDASEFVDCYTKIRSRFKEPRQFQKEIFAEYEASISYPAGLSRLAKLLDEFGMGRISG